MLLTLSFLGSGAGQLFHQAVSGVFYVHSALTHLSFQTRLVLWLRFLHRTIYHHRLHRKTKLTTANVVIYPSVLLFAKNGGKHSILLIFLSYLVTKINKCILPVSERVALRLKALTPHLSRAKESVFTHKYQDKPLCHQNVHLLPRQVAEGTWP